MLVSVIMSTYNEKEIWLKEAIESILNQSYKEFEFIIVCDNPRNGRISDLLYEYESIDERIELIINKTNIGLASSLNKAIRKAEGQYIARMDADDISSIDRIEKQLAFMKLNEEIDIISSNIILIDEFGIVIRNGIAIPNDKELINKALKYVNVMNHPTWFLKKSAIDRLGGYNDYDAAQDYDLLLRARKEKMQFGYLNELLLKYRIRENSISNSKRLYRLKLEEIIKKKNLYENKIINNNIKIGKFEEVLFNFSQKLLNEANDYRFKKNIFLFFCFIILSNIMSSSQIRRTYNILRVRLMLKSNKYLKTQ